MLLCFNLTVFSVDLIFESLHLTLCMFCVTRRNSTRNVSTWQWTPPTAGVKSFCFKSQLIKTAQYQFFSLQCIFLLQNFYTWKTSAVKSHLNWNHNFDTNLQNRNKSPPEHLASLPPLSNECCFIIQWYHNADDFWFLMEINSKPEIWN